MNPLTRHIVLPIRDFIYPPLCFTCNRLLSEDEHRVCSSCWRSFTRVDPSHPAWIGIKGRFDLEGVVGDLVSCFLFEKGGKLQDVIHELKYRGMKSLGVRLGEEIGNHIARNPELRKADWLIPVPLHRLKQRERGYNQSEYVCRGIARVSGIPSGGTFIRRHKYTETQAQLTVEQRRENVGNAFTIPANRRPFVNGKTCILVDDVITTGSTIGACARELRKNNAAGVFAASVALAP